MLPIFVALFLYEYVSQSSAELPLNMEACSIGDVIENECSKCTCTTRNVYECKQKPCPKSSKDELFSRAQWGGVLCHPHKIYHQLTTICICRADGSWPHESCYSTFRALPAAKIVKKKCTGKKYAIIDCNICMCNKNGQIESERCTQNECDKDDTQDDRRRKAKNSHLFGNCKANNWYSLAPCQFCYCLNNNKLMCNTGSNNVGGIQLGTYNFSLCGSEFLKEALELIPADQKGRNIMRMSEDAQSPPTVSTTEVTTTKPTQKPKTFEIEELFEKADLERMQQKENEKHVEHEEYDSDTNEKTDIVTKKTTTMKPLARDRTQQPYDEMDGDYSEDRADKALTNDDDDDDSEEDDKVEPIKPKAVPVKKGRSEAYDDDADDTVSGSFDLGAALKHNLPYMLSKVFNVRKTVVLDSQAKCEPGSQLMVACNVCHCMKNGKMLCTDKKCD